MASIEESEIQLGQYKTDIQRVRENIGSQKAAIDSPAYLRGVTSLAAKMQRERIAQQIGNSETQLTSNESSVAEFEQAIGAAKEQRQESIDRAEAYDDAKKYAYQAVIEGKTVAIRAAYINLKEKGYDDAYQYYLEMYSYYKNQTKEEPNQPDITAPTVSDEYAYINIDEISNPNAKIMTREEAGLIPLPNYNISKPKQPNNNVEYYYDIENPNIQISKPAGVYTDKGTALEYPIENPQNVLANTNYGLGYNTKKTNGEKVDLYFDIDNPNIQFTKPLGDYKAGLTPVVPLSYSVTRPSTIEGVETETTTYSYGIDVNSIKPNINLPSENRFGFDNIDWKVGFEGGFVRRDEFGREKITPQTFIDYQFQKQVSRINPYSQAILDAAFFNVQTRKIDKDSKAYQILSSKPNFSAVNTAKFIAFQPIMETGTQTYYGIFGNQAVKSSSNKIYLSPIEKIKIPEALNALKAAKYKSLGEVVAKKGNTVVIDSGAVKEVVAARAFTTSRNIIQPTGIDRVSVFTKGTTYVNVNSLSGTTFSYAQPFTFQGRIINIAASKIEVIRAKEGFKITQDVTKGELSGFYYPAGSRNPIEIKGIDIYSRQQEGYTQSISFKGNKILGTGQVFDLNRDLLFPYTDITPSWLKVTKISTPYTETIKTSTPSKVYDSITFSSKNTKSLFDYSPRIVTGEPTRVGGEFTAQNLYEGTFGASSLSGIQTNLGIPITNFGGSSDLIKGTTLSLLSENVRNKDITKLPDRYDFGLVSNTKYNFAEKADETTKTETGTRTGTRTGVTEIQIPAIKIIEEQTQTEKTKYDDIFVPNPDVPFVPRIKVPFIFGTDKKKSLFSKVKQAFKVVTYRRGKEVTVAKGLPEGLARKAGVKTVLSTLRASFKLKPEGETTIEDIDYKIPQGFKLSKVDKNRYVQLKNTRFGARSETKEAQFFRKQKAGKVKWF